MDGVIVLTCHLCKTVYTNDTVTLEAAQWIDDEPTCEACEKKVTQTP